jgi:hypothetical protein
MEVKLRIQQNGKPATGINAYVVDGDDSWAEIAATSNDKGEIGLPVTSAGTYVVRIQTSSGAKDVRVKTGEEPLISI